ncbi:38K [Phenacoccus solenopsis nudivirus]|nr:38K [Phenacoccus solenopsis nudivirus]
MNLTATLIVHDSLWSRKLEERMRKSFNRVLRFSKLVFTPVNAYIVDNDEVSRCSLYLERYYEPDLSDYALATASSTASTDDDGRGRCEQLTLAKRYQDSADYTSAVVPKQGCAMVSLGAEKYPRFVIWPMKLELAVNANAVAFCRQGDWQDVISAMFMAEKWALPMTTKEPTMTSVTCCVFDLDDTLINNDDDDRLIAYTLDTLRYARERFDYVVLYTHGDERHVRGNVCVKRFQFDFIVNYERERERRNVKNVLTLYRYMKPNEYIQYAVLVDDSAYNWAHEYDDIVIPLRGNKTSRGIATALDRIIRQNALLRLAVNRKRSFPL